jgi:hypothetical protein
VCLDPTLGEEPQRLSRVGALLYAEDLNVHACRLDIMERHFRSGLENPQPVS